MSSQGEARYQCKNMTILSVLWLKHVLYFYGCTGNIWYITLNQWTATFKRSDWLLKLRISCAAHRREILRDTKQVRAFHLAVVRMQRLLQWNWLLMNAKIKNKKTFFLSIFNNKYFLFQLRRYVTLQSTKQNKIVCTLHFEDRFLAFGFCDKHHLAIFIHWFGIYQNNCSFLCQVATSGALRHRKYCFVVSVCGSYAIKLWL